MTVRRATFYFALVYFSQGICQTVTLLNQPLRMYLQDVARLDSSGIADFMFVVTIPWMIKPAYGLLSDFFPLFGYRRKSYLLLTNAIAAGSFLLISGVHSTQAVLAALVLTGVGVAASDVVVDAMMVQSGQQTGRTRLFQGAQWTALNVAAILSGLLGSAICAHFPTNGSAALRTAALIAMVIPLVVAVLTWFLVTDRRARMNVPEFKAATFSLFGAFKSLRLWLVVGFIFLTRFNPGVQTALYDHLKSRVGLSQSYLAILDTWFSVGQVVGSIVFLSLMSGKLSTKVSVTIGLVAGAAGLLPMLVITGKASANLAYASWGMTDMIASLALLTVAAEACPKRVEAVVFAALMSVYNLAQSWSDIAGSRLYDGLLHHRINPLVLLSAAFTAAGLVLIPLLKPAPAEDDAAPVTDPAPATAS